MATLPEPESGTKRPKPPHPKTRLSPWCHLPNHKSFDYSEVLICMVAIRKCETPITNISQESWHTHDYMSICGLQLEINSSGPILVFFPKSF